MKKKFAFIFLWGVFLFSAGSTICMNTVKRCMQMFPFSVLHFSYEQCIEEKKRCLREIKKKEQVKNNPFSSLESIQRAEALCRDNLIPYLCSIQYKINDYKGAMFLQRLIRCNGGSLKNRPIHLSDYVPTKKKAPKEKYDRWDNIIMQEQIKRLFKLINTGY